MLLILTLICAILFNIVKNNNGLINISTDKIINGSDYNFVLKAGNYLLNENGKIYLENVKIM